MADENANANDVDDAADAAVPQRVVIIFEELSQAPASFVQPLMTLFDAGYVVADGKPVHCPVPLIILCVGNCPDKDSVLANRAHDHLHPPPDSELHAEVCACMKHGALNTRVVKLVVPFFPYRSSQFPGIARRMLERLRLPLGQDIDAALRPDAFVFTPPLLRWVIKLLSPDCNIRAVRSQVLLLLRAAANNVINNQRSRLSDWAKIYCTVTADNRIVVQEHMVQPEDETLSLRETWSAMLAYLNRLDAPDIIFLPDPSVLFLVHEQCRALQSSGFVDVQEVLVLMLGAVRLRARAHRAELRARCVYRLLAKFDAEDQMVDLQVFHINSDDANFCAMSLFDTRVLCPVPLFQVAPTAISPRRFQRIVSYAFGAWSKLVLSCKEFAGSKELLLLFAHVERRWPTKDELEAIKSPWRYSGPLGEESVSAEDCVSDSRDFFSRYCGFVPSAEAEASEAHQAALNAAAAVAASADDAVSVSSSAASRAVRLARAPQPRKVPEALLTPPGGEAPVLCIPLSKRVLAIKCGWSASETNSKFEAVRNAFKRQLGSFVIRADASSSEQNALRARYLADLKITIQATTSFVPVAEIDKLQQRNAPAAAAAEGPMVIDG